VLGWTIPQKEAFYDSATLASPAWLVSSGPMVAQACATSVAAIHAAAASQQGHADGARLVVTTDRTASNGPHLVYPRTSRPGRTADSENWVLDSFER
jgi:acetyl-CoA C-acetyltransferase